MHLPLIGLAVVDCVVTLSLNWNYPNADLSYVVSALPVGEQAFALQIYNRSRTREGRVSDMIYVSFERKMQVCPRFYNHLHSSSYRVHMR